MTQFNYFTYKSSRLYCEDCDIESIAKEQGTPLYIYSHEAITKQYQTFAKAFSHWNNLVCYSVKANSNAAILKSLFNIGCGADVVSGGELQRAINAGCGSQKIVFSGVGKTKDEIELGLNHDILLFNVESEQELDAIQAAAKRLNKNAPISIRVNPDVDAKTHPYISTGLKTNKFGVSHTRAIELYKKAIDLDCIEIKGISCHIGSQITQAKPFLDAMEKLRSIVLELKKLGQELQHIDVGGGLGIFYQNEDIPSEEEYAKAVMKHLEDLGCQIITEPGRFIVGNAGALVTQVTYTKTGEDNTEFAIVDAGFNDLMRPMLYNAYHDIVPVIKHKDRALVSTNIEGPICESTDRFAKDRQITQVKPGEYLSIMSSGAYSMCMANAYNSRPRPAEVLVKGDKCHVIKKRDTIEDLTRNEVLPKFLEK